MQVQNRRLEQLLRLLIDCLAIVLAWQCTIRLRFSLNPVLDRYVNLEGPLGWVPPLEMILPLWVTGLASSHNESGPFLNEQ